MAIRQQSPNYRQNMMVSQQLQASTAITHGDVYKTFWATTNITVTLPQAVAGAGPFYFFCTASSGGMTVTPQAADNILGLNPGIGMGLTPGAFVGLFSIAGSGGAATWQVIENVNPTLTTNLVGAIISVGATSNETRTSTTTPTNSTQLQLSLVPGTWEIDWAVLIKQAAAGTVGVNYNINYSGTFTQGAGHIGIGTTATSTAAAFFGPGFCAATVGQTQFSAGSLDTFGDCCFGEGTIITTTAGTLALAFAQNTSSATVVTLVGQSNPFNLLRARRIA